MICEFENSEKVEKKSDIFILFLHLRMGVNNSSFMHFFYYVLRKLFKPNDSPVIIKKNVVQTLATIYS